MSATRRILFPGFLAIAFAGFTQTVLRIAPSNNAVVLSWPTNQYVFTVEQSTNLSAANFWFSAPGQGILQTTQYQAVEAVSGTTFYRLAQSVVFVAPPPFGNDANAGTQPAPLATIEAGIAQAAKLGANVYVATGTYTPAGTLQLVSGVSLYGLYDGTTNWGRAASNTTRIVGAITAVLAQNITNETHLEGFVIQSANAAGSGASSYGIRVNSSVGSLFIRSNAIMAGNGSSGVSGNSGSSGANGVDGTNGTVGACDSRVSAPGGGGGSSCGSVGGTGGAGGYATAAGVSGAPGSGGAAGGSGGASGTTGSGGNTGANGGPGSNGVNAPAAPNLGTLLSDGAYSVSVADPGTPGANGNSGGGGGGGGGQSCTACLLGTGNGGGGGGGGGCGATAGNGGSGGGGSFAITVASSSNVIISNNVLVAANGGHGGNGGSGGSGGFGGAGGTGGQICTTEVGAGGPGGHGGSGGFGGSGAGAPGGPAIGIFYSAGLTIAMGSNTFTNGLGGAGGSGGNNGALGTAPNGATGVTANTFAH